MIREVRPEEKSQFNLVVNHPIQSWEWGEFRRRTGLKVRRVGFYPAGRLQKGLQVTFHPLPGLRRTVGYYPKGFMPDEDQLAVLKQLGRQHQALFIKLEPDVAKEVGHTSAHRRVADFLLQHGAVAGRPQFANFSSVIDLTKSTTELFASLNSKTRYNVNLAVRKGVAIFENTTDRGLETYLDILSETTKRQGFYAHTPDYFRQMWQSLGPAGTMRFFEARYQHRVLVSWIIFVFNRKLYYPYGASRSEHKEVMASNLLMWEMIVYGQKQHCTHFDLWGCLGPQASPRHPWYGFHKFKQGYGGQHLEYLGSYDLVLEPAWYRVFKLAETWRWRWLRLKAKFSLV